MGEKSACKILVIYKLKYVSSQKKDTRALPDFIWQEPVGALVNMVTKIYVPQKERNFLSNWVTDYWSSQGGAFSTKLFFFLFCVYVYLFIYLFIYYLCSREFHFFYKN
jgi:uncharacterized membrane protein